MSWYPSEFHGAMTSRRRAIAWRCRSDSRLEVRHCGHPTALRPYYVVIDGKERVDFGTFRTLEQAQHKAMVAADAGAWQRASIVASTTMKWR